MLSFLGRLLRSLSVLTAVQEQAAAEVSPEVGRAGFVREASGVFHYHPRGERSLHSVPEGKDK